MNDVENVFEKMVTHLRKWKEERNEGKFVKKIGLNGIMGKPPFS